jgi:hypothetical protein
MKDFRAIAEILGSRRLSMNSERQLQAEILAALEGAGIEVTPEVRLDAHSRIDFLAGGTGIEAKIGGGRLAVWRQCQRYARHERIDALILVGSVPMPADLADCEGKPFRFVSVGRSWL